MGEAGALLLVGPVLGAPRAVRSNAKIHLMIPILLEVDAKVSDYLMDSLVDWLMWTVYMLLLDDAGSACEEFIFRA